MTRRGIIRNMSRVHNELAKIRRERAREANATPARATPPGNPEATVDARLEQIARTQVEAGKVTLQDVLGAQIEQERLKTEIANLDDSRNPMLAQLNGFFTIVERMRAVDTAGIEPLYTPLSAVQHVTLRLRDDAVTEPDQREANQRSAPEVEDGLFLVPKVIE